MLKGEEEKYAFWNENGFLLWDIAYNKLNC